MKIFLTILLIYLIFRFIRSISILSFRSRPLFRDDPPETPPPAPKQNKIIEKDEGEYVDFEEMKD